MKKIFCFVVAFILCLPAAVFAGEAATAPAKKFYIGAGGSYAIQNFDIENPDALKRYGFDTIEYDNTIGFNAFLGFLPAFLLAFLLPAPAGSPGISGR